LDLRGPTSKRKGKKGRGQRRAKRWEGEEEENGKAWTNGRGGRWVLPFLIPEYAMGAM